MVEIEEALKVEVSEIRRNYCLQVWNEALNQAKVEASSALRRAKSVHYPPAIRAPGSASFKANTAPKVAELGKDSPAKVPFSIEHPSKEVEQLEVVEKEADTTKGVALNAIKPLAAPQDQTQKKEVPLKNGDCLRNSPYACQGGPQG